MNGFIDKIEQLRRDHGYTNLQVARALGSENEAFYRRKTSGKVRFNYDDIKALIALYHLNSEQIADLFS